MDITYIVLIIGIVVVFIFTAVYTKVTNYSKISAIFREQYGKKPKNKDMDFELIELYYTEAEHTDSGSLIDDETWDDLDMKEVFGRINATSSFAGEQYLYASLRILSGDKGRFEDYERKMAYFEENPKERTRLQYEVWKIGKRSSSYYLPVFFNQIEAFKISHIWIYRIMQMLLAAGLLLAVIVRENWAFTVAVVIFLLNLTVYGFMKTKYETQLEVIGGIHSMIRAVRDITEKKELNYTEEFPELTKVQKELRASEKKFRFLLGRKNSALTGDMMEMAATYITGAFLLDFTIYNKLIREISGKMDTFIWLYELIGELDMLLSTASFRKSLPRYCTPQFQEELSVKMEDIYHPLIDNPIYNSVELGKNTIITGSNASGKSTFIKAVAVNQILAQTIYTCTARSFTLPLSYVKSSMAVRDDLMGGESYYMKEIKSLKRTVESAGGKRPVLCAVDEILRGTNTNERLAASAAILKYLRDKSCIVIVATHDLEMLEMLKEENYSYYYFSEQPDNGDVIFDYKIHNGVSKETNAIKLLERIGFPDEVVKNARENLRKINVTKSQK